MNISSFKIMATHSTTLSRKNRSIITLHPFINAVLGDIWKFTLEKNLKCNHCDYASAHASDLIDIWKLTLGLNPTNATNMNLHLFRKTIWGDIWKFTLEKNLTNANFASNLNFHWRDIWQLTLAMHHTYYHTISKHGALHLFKEAKTKSHSGEKSFKCNQAMLVESISWGTNLEKRLKSV